MLHQKYSALRSTFLYISFFGASYTQKILIVTIYLVTKINHTVLIPIISLHSYLDDYNEHVCQGLPWNNTRYCRFHIHTYIPPLGPVGLLGLVDGGVGSDMLLYVSI